MIQAISIGDLLRAVKRLEPSSDSQVSDIFGLLGFQTGAPTEGSTDRRVTSPRVITPGIKPDSDDPFVMEPLLKLHSPPPLFPSHDSALVPTSFEPLGDFSTLPQFGVEPLPPPANDPLYKPMLEPLLVPRLTRGILCSAASMLLEGGEFDSEKIVRQLATLRSTHHLPRKRRFSVRRGVQVFVDRSDRMLPFQLDQVQFVRAIRQYLGPELVRVFAFSRPSKADQVCELPGTTPHRFRRGWL